MSYEITAKLHKVFDTEKKTDSFTSRDFVLIEDSGQYPNYIKMQLVQDRCSIIEQFEVGDTLKVWFDIRGKEWQDKVFVNLNAWRIERG